MHPEELQLAEAGQFAADVDGPLHHPIGGHRHHHRAAVLVVVVSIAAEHPGDVERVPAFGHPPSDAGSAWHAPAQEVRAAVHRRDHQLVAFAQHDRALHVAELLACEMEQRLTAHRVRSSQRLAAHLGQAQQ